MSIKSRAACAAFKQPNPQTPTALRRGAWRRYLHVSKHCVAVHDPNTGAVTFAVPRRGGITYRPNQRTVQS